MREPRAWKMETGPGYATSSLVKDILVARRATHGDWRQTAGCSQAIETAMSLWRTATLKPHHREALHQLAVKMARINCGDPDFPDHWDDIAGYADETAKVCRDEIPF